MRAMHRIAGVLACTTAVAAGGRYAGTRPNFVLMFVDDSGYGDYGFNDPSILDTPNLDALRALGMRFSDFHAAASVCSPSRAGLLTGRFGLRTGVVNNFGPFSKDGLPMNETTLAELLRSAGYRTAMGGKWHLGHNGQHHPIHRGFQRFRGLPMSHDYGCTDHPGPDMGCAQCQEPYGECNDACGSVNADGKECHIGPNNPWNESIPLYEGLNIVEQPVDLRALSDKYGSFAEEFIADAAGDPSAPFFLYMAFSHLHVPVAYNFTRWGGQSMRGMYGDAVRELDHTVGRIVGAVKAAGAMDDTLFVMTADNGASDNQCEFGGSNLPFVGVWQREYGGGGSTGKLSTWEGGHHEPGIAVWVGHIPPASTTTALAGAIDVFPTFAALAGAPLPSNRVYDGVDLSGVLFDGEQTAHSTLVHPNSGEGKHGEIETVRVGRYKAKWRTGGGSPECAKQPEGPRVAPSTRHDQPLLFDLWMDPSERTALSPANGRYANLTAEADAVVAAFYDSVRADNTTVASYAEDTSVRPCCDKSQPFCRCKQ